MAATSAALARPERMVLDTGNDLLYIADTGNGLVHRLNQRTGILEIVAGSVDENAPDPTPNNQSATSVKLVGPRGLALDSASQLLFIADFNGILGNYILEVDLANETLRIVVGQDFDVLGKPAQLAFQEFSQGSRMLFILNEGVAAGLLPAVVVHDLDAGVTQALPTTLDFRRVFDLILTGPENPGDEVDLLVVADVGEDFEDEYGRNNIPPPEFNNDPTLDPETILYEINCFDGLADFPGGATDFDSDDCREPLRLQVLRFHFPSTGPNLLVDNDPDVELRAFKKFLVTVNFDDDVCPGVNGEQSVLDSEVDFPDLLIDAIAVDRFGRVILVDPVTSTVQLVQRDAQNVASTTILAGTDLPFLSPADGERSVLTRLSRPQAILMDDLDNLYIADTVNNRIRRVWVGDLLPVPGQ